MKHSDSTLNPHFRISAWLLLWILAICIIPNVILSFTEQLSVFQRITNTILPLGIYGLLCSLSRHIGRTGLWMFIVMFFAAFQIVLLYLFGRSVIAVDMFLNLVTTNPSEATELLANMLPVVVLVAVLYLPTLTICILAVIKKWRLSDQFIRPFRIISISVIALGVVFFGLSFTGTREFNPVSDIYPLNVAENIVIAVKRTVKVNNYHTTSAGFTFNACSQRPAEEKEVYVMVIGETSRAQQWSLLGYSDKNTTAPLDSISGLIPFSRAISESNTTHKSVPMLLSMLDAYNFEDSIYYSKSIITAFKEAGFSTAFISNQARNHSFIDFFGNEADTTLFINEKLTGEHPHMFDHDLLPEMQKFINAGEKQKIFIVLHTYGSHFCYSDRYPTGQEPFLPDSPIDVTARNFESLINAYDNSIHYTARQLASISAMLSGLNCKAAMIYTSDHGEDIFDDSRRMFLHASPVPSYYQLHVPLILWLSPQLAQSNPHFFENALAHRNDIISSSDVFFHTTLGLAGITTPLYKPGSDLTSEKFKPKNLIYLNDHNKATPLWECGLQKQDFEKFRQLGITG